MSSNTGDDMLHLVRNIAKYGARLEKAHGEKIGKRTPEDSSSSPSPKKASSKSSPSPKKASSKSSPKTHSSDFSTPNQPKVAKKATSEKKRVTPKKKRSLHHRDSKDKELSKSSSVGVQTNESHLSPNSSPNSKYSQSINKHSEKKDIDDVVRNYLTKGGQSQTSPRPRVSPLYKKSNSPKYIQLSRPDEDNLEPKTNFNNTPKYTDNSSDISSDHPTPQSKPKTRKFKHHSSQKKVKLCQPDEIRISEEILIVERFTQDETFSDQYKNLKPFKLPPQLIIPNKEQDNPPASQVDLDKYSYFKPPETSPTVNFSFRTPESKKKSNVNVPKNITPPLTPQSLYPSQFTQENSQLPPLKKSQDRFQRFLRDLSDDSFDAVLNENAKRENELIKQEKEMEQRSQEEFDELLNNVEKTVQKEVEDQQNANFEVDNDELDEILAENEEEDRPIHPTDLLSISSDEEEDEDIKNFFKESNQIKIENPNIQKESDMGNIEGDLDESIESMTDDNKADGEVNVDTESIHSETNQSDDEQIIQKQEFSNSESEQTINIDDENEQIVEEESDKEESTNLDNDFINEEEQNDNQEEEQNDIENEEQLNDDFINEEEDNNQNNEIIEQLDDDFINEEENHKEEIDIEQLNDDNFLNEEEDNNQKDELEQLNDDFINEEEDNHKEEIDIEQLNDDLLNEEEDIHKDELDQLNDDFLNEEEDNNKNNEIIEQLNDDFLNEEEDNNHKEEIEQLNDDFVNEEEENHKEEIEQLNDDFLNEEEDNNKNNEIIEQLNDDFLNEEEENHKEEIDIEQLNDDDLLNEVEDIHKDELEQLNDDFLNEEEENQNNEFTIENEENPEEQLKVDDVNEEEDNNNQNININDQSTKEEDNNNQMNEEEDNKLNETDQIKAENEIDELLDEIDAMHEQQEMKKQFELPTQTNLDAGNKKNLIMLVQMLFPSDDLETKAEAMKALIDSNLPCLLDIFKTIFNEIMAIALKKHHDRVAAFGHALSLLVPKDSDYRQYLEKIAFELIPLSNPLEPYTIKDDDENNDQFKGQALSAAILFSYWARINDYSSLFKWIELHTINDQNGNDSFVNYYAVVWFLKCCSYLLFVHNRSQFEQIKSLINNYSGAFKSQNGSLSNKISSLQTKVKEFEDKYESFLSNENEDFKEKYNFCGVIPTQEVETNENEQNEEENSNENEIEVNDNQLNQNENQLNQNEEENSNQNEIEVNENENENENELNQNEEENSNEKEIEIDVNENEINENGLNLIENENENQLDENQNENELNQNEIELNQNEIELNQNEIELNQNEEENSNENQNEMNDILNEINDDEEEQNNSAMLNDLDLLNKNNIEEEEDQSSNIELNISHSNENDDNKIENDKEDDISFDDNEIILDDDNQEHNDGSQNDDEEILVIDDDDNDANKSNDEQTNEDDQVLEIEGEFQVDQNEDGNIDFEINNDM